MRIANRCVEEIVMRTTAYEYLAYKYIINTLRDDSDGGSQITQLEQEKIREKADWKDLGSELIDEMVGALRTNDGTSYFSQGEINDIENKYQEGQRSLDVLAGFSYNIGSLKLFAPNSSYSEWFNSFNIACDDLEKRTGLQIITDVNAVGNQYTEGSLFYDVYGMYAHEESIVFQNVLAGDHDVQLKTWHESYGVEKITIGALIESAGLDFSTSEEILAILEDYSKLIRSFPKHDSVLSLEFELKQEEYKEISVLKQEEKEAFLFLSSNHEDDSSLYKLYLAGSDLVQFSNTYKRVNELIPTYDNGTGKKQISLDQLIKDLRGLENLDESDWLILNENKENLLNHIPTDRPVYNLPLFLQGIASIFHSGKPQPLVLAYFPGGIWALDNEAEFLALEEVLTKYHSNTMLERVKSLPLDTFNLNLDDTIASYLVFIDIISSEEGYGLIKKVFEMGAYDFILDIIMNYDQLSELKHSERVKVLDDYCEYYPQLRMRNFPIQNYLNTVFDDDEKKQFMRDLSKVYPEYLLETRRRELSEYGMPRTVVVCHQLDALSIDAFYKSKTFWLDDDYRAYIEVFNGIFTLDPGELISLVLQVSKINEGNVPPINLECVERAIGLIKSLDGDLNELDPLEICEVLHNIPLVNENGIEVLSRLVSIDFFENSMDFIRYIPSIAYVQDDESLIQAIVNNDTWNLVRENIIALKDVLDEETNSFPTSHRGYSNGEERLAFYNQQKLFLLIDAFYLPENINIREIYEKLKQYKSEKSVITFNDVLHYAHNEADRHVLLSDDFDQFIEGVKMAVDRQYRMASTQPRDLIYYVRLYHEPRKGLMKELRKKRFINNCEKLDTKLDRQESRLGIRPSVLYSMYRNPLESHWKKFDEFISENYPQGVPITTSGAYFDLMAMYSMIQRNESVREIYESFINGNDSMLLKIISERPSEKINLESHFSGTYEIRDQATLPPYLRLKAFLVTQALQTDIGLRERLRYSLYRDTVNESSELAGILEFNDENLSFDVRNIDTFPRGNNAYYPYDPDIEVSPFAFHNHAISLYEAPYAGPSTLDFNHVFYTGSNPLVVSSIDERDFNVDLYGPAYSMALPLEDTCDHEGYVLDLGVYSD
jgi:hypothetical protein